MGSRAGTRPRCPPQRAYLRLGFSGHPKQRLRSHYSQPTSAPAVSSSWALAFHGSHASRPTRDAFTHRTHTTNTHARSPPSPRRRLPIRQRLDDDRETPRAPKKHTHLTRRQHTVGRPEEKTRRRRGGERRRSSAGPFWAACGTVDDFVLSAAAFSFFSCSLAGF